jgi:hypothetical protein
MLATPARNALLYENSRSESMTREEANRIIQRRSGKYSDYVHACAVVYEDEMRRQHQALGPVGVHDAALPSEPWPAGTIGALVRNQEIGGDLIMKLEGGVFDFFISPLKDGSGRAGLSTGSAPRLALPAAASHAESPAWPRSAISRAG